jgi:hypothetical protein
MVIRPFQIEDLRVVEDINNRFYTNYDPIDAAQAYADIVADKNNKLVAYGLNRFLSEAVMVLDHSLSNRDKIEALILLMKEAKSKCCHRQLFVRVQDPQFGAILKKHFNFRESKGILLVSDVE